MRRVPFVLLLMVLAAASLAFTVWMRDGTSAREALDESAASLAETPDSARLAAMGLQTGRHLVAVYFSGSRCLLCSTPEMRSAVSRLRERLREANRSDFASVATVGVAINSDLVEGLEYLRSLGLENFDEISTGKGWLNEMAASHLWSDSLRAVSVPRVVLIARTVTARLDPFDIDLSRDSIVGVVRGAPSVVKWIDLGPSIARANDPSLRDGLAYP